MDSRDFRKKWLQLQESWNEEAGVNVNATKAEKLEEKRKLPDALKAHQFGKKKDSDDGVEDKKTLEKNENDEKEDVKKDDKKKATEAVKSANIKNLKFKVGKGAKPMAKKPGLPSHVRSYETKTESEGGATTSAAVGGEKGVCPDAHIGSSDRLQKRKQPEMVVTAKESNLFSHFKKFMAEAGIPLAPESGVEVPVNDVAAGAMGELTGEEPAVDVASDAPMDDVASVLVDIQARFPGKKIHICVESEPTEPFSDSDIAAAEAAIESVPEEVGLEGDEGAEEMLPPEVKAEMPVDQDISDEVRVESISMREDSDEDMGVADDVEEIPTGADVGADVAGIEGEDDIGDDMDVEISSEASPAMISMTPEQWMEFLAGGTEETGLGDELAGATNVADAGEGDDSGAESNKSPDTLG